jgi:hypothetical protein
MEEPLSLVIFITLPLPLGKGKQQVKFYVSDMFVSSCSSSRFLLCVTQSYVVKQ